MNRDERSNSTSSNESAGTAPRRASGTLFASLHQQKRSDDPRSVARRQSMNEQRPQPGFIGKMWER